MPVSGLPWRASSATTRRKRSTARAKSGISRAPAKCISAATASAATNLRNCTRVLGEKLGRHQLALQQVDEREAREVDRRFDHDAVEDLAAGLDRGDDADANAARVDAVDAGGEHRLAHFDDGL